MLDFDRRSAGAANEMVVAVARDLIHQMLLGIQGGLDNAVLRQEIQRAVDRWLRDPGRRTPGLLVDLNRKQMRS